MRFITGIIALLSLMLVFPPGAYASGSGVENMTKLNVYIERALDQAGTDLKSSKKSYDQFHDQWLQVEGTIKADSVDAYKDIESQMGQVEYAYMTEKSKDAKTALQGLEQAAEDFIAGKYGKSTDSTDQDLSLSDFIHLLQQIKDNVHAQDQQQSLEAISKARETWLSVEGIVVAQSASVYSSSERDMVVIQAMVKDQKFDNAEKTTDDMIAYLTPLSQKSAYTFWDAAMIPIREGLEALLVVGALLSFAKKSNKGHGKVWILSGVGAGLVLSTILAIIIKVVFSSGAFGRNNFIISGWTGVFAAAMLLYMSYWLHSNSNMNQWNRFIKSKTETAMSTGRVVSLGLLSFLAVFREGTETVLFIIGMINQISVQQLLLGMLIGFGFLAVLAFLMLYVGFKLPIRPFFMISSLIVFYLCIKFMGLGIHSLQLAGIVPVSNSSTLPSIDFIAFYPSWQSSAPQLVITLFAIGFLIMGRLRKNRSKAQIAAT
ncbi:high-affinity iron transporter [Paenibacillus taihuensis]|uniref:High-affinity iron transporter n=1 Tax=Paenibacillus taihuensis TaxID=1156355 RepID=A0A3D9RQ37_9BACL|nr:FTR1 family protein [Paenibacillus taihuensis]REE78575.1 high-affinity iron transporter [Paenibacillus taihuensis]